MSSDSNLKKSLQDYQYYEKLSKQIKINAKLNSHNEKQISLIPDNKNDTIVKIHVPELRIPLCTSRHEAEVTQLNHKDYLQISSQGIKYIKKPQILDQKKIQTVTKSLNKGLLNDYVELVNKRSLILKNFTQSFHDIDQIQNETNEYLLKYYGVDSYYRQIIEKTVSKIHLILYLLFKLDHIGPSNKYMKNIAMSNHSKIQKKVDEFSKQIQLKLLQQVPQKKLKYKTRLEQFQSYFQEKDESNFLKKKIEYDSKFNKVDDDEKQQKKFDKNRFLKDKMLECEFRQKGIENIKKNVYETEMKNIIIQKPQTNKIKIRQKKKNEIKEYLNKIQSYDNLLGSYRMNIRSQQFNEAIKMQEVLKKKEKANGLENKKLLDQMKSADESEINNQQLGRILSVQQLSERKLSGSTCTSGSHLFQMLQESSRTMKNQNKRFFRNIKNSQKQTSQQFQILSKKYNKFQELCELGDNLKALEN